MTVRANDIAIIPEPVSVVPGDGVFKLTTKTRILLADDDPQLKNAVAVFAADAEKAVGKELRIEVRKPKKGAINVSLNPSLEKEAYTFVVSPDRIEVEGGSPRGVFYAFQSLRQLIPDEAFDQPGVAAIPAVQVEDEPCFSYRSMMLDVCRHFFTVEEVKTYIDMLALHKMNTFHWHLTDDQGWRIEIKRYPELTTVGAQRNQTVVGRMKEKDNTYDGKPYGGYYTQDEIREVVRYAAERFVDIIPEIEMPGHATAALAAYSWLGCTGGPYEVWPDWGINNEVFCMGRESTFEFLENVLSEVLELFPGKYIHIGGDECPRDRWKECPDCQARMKAEGFTDEAQLQSYLNHRIEQWLNERGRSMIGWDEILEGNGVSKTATVMSWRGTKGGITAARMGNHVIMVPFTHCYFDYHQTKTPDREPLGIGGYIPVEQVYTLDPYDSLTVDEYPYILGVQSNLWTEYITSLSHIQLIVLPRAAALAEVGWSYDRKDYARFRKHMERMVKLYTRCGYNFAPYMFEEPQDENSAKEVSADE